MVGLIDAPFSTGEDTVVAEPLAVRIIGIVVDLVVDAVDEFRVLQLEPLVGIKLTAFRDKDRTQLRDMLKVGLIDAAWANRYPRELGDRLLALIATTGG